MGLLPWMEEAEGLVGEEEDEEVGDESACDDGEEKRTQEAEAGMAVEKDGDGSAGCADVEEIAYRSWQTRCRRWTCNRSPENN